MAIPTHDMRAKRLTHALTRGLTLRATNVRRLRESNAILVVVSRAPGVAVPHWLPVGLTIPLSPR
jgi:hypothetical protein